MTIDELIELIGSTLNIPYIEENNAVMDGSFTLAPYMSNAEYGDGKAISISDMYGFNIFYSDKSDAMTATKTIWSVLNQNNIRMSFPTYLWEPNANIYRASMNLEVIGG